jgi:AraC-like DNA-binding protein
MSISVIVARGLVAEVENRGLDPRELLERSHIEATRLADLRATLSVEEADLLTRNAMEMTEDPGLGLSIGIHAPASMLQVIGHLLLAQSTIREAFAALRRYSSLLADGPIWGLIERDEVAMFTYEPPVQLGDSTRCGVDYTLAMTARVGQHFSPYGSSLKEVHLQHPAPIYAQRYQEVFMCPVRFEMPTNALVFPREYIDRLQPHADGTVRAVLNETAERLLQERAQSRSVADRVRTLLRYERDLREIHVDRIARQLGISGRSLRRRLGAEGTPLTMLVDEARCRTACHELRRSDTTIKATAELLGFSEPSAFHRAFKRWTGRTPTEYARLSDAELDGRVGALVRLEPRADRPAAHTRQASQ